MPWIAAIGAGAASLAGGIAGAVSNNNASKRAANTAAQAAQSFRDIQDPDYEAMRLALEEYQLTGRVTPQLEQLIQQQQTAMNNMQPEDPRLRQAEMDALSTLANISNNKGLDAQARLTMEEARLKNATEARGARQANLTNAAQRGILGSGLEFVGNQMADQNAANSNYLMGLQQAGLASQRDLEALQQLTGLSNTVQNRDFSQAAAKAQAQDAINRFNAQMSADTQQRNIAALNQAQAANLAAQQKIADQNVALRNQQQTSNKAIAQQKFQNDLEKTRGAAGLAPAQMGAQTAQGQAYANAAAGLAQGASGILTNVYNNQQGSAMDNYYKELLRQQQAKGSV